MKLFHVSKALYNGNGEEMKGILHLEVSGVRFFI